MNLVEDLFLCNYCLQYYSNENIRKVKLRAVEFIRDYLNHQLIKLNRICLNCINDHVRNIAYEYKYEIILNSISFDIDYISNSNELNLTLQYIDQNGNFSIRISSRFISILTIEQIIDYIIQTFDLSISSNNLLLKLIKKENNNNIWYPIIYMINQQHYIN